MNTHPRKYFSYMDFIEELNINIENNMNSKEKSPYKEIVKNSLINLNAEELIEILNLDNIDLDNHENIQNIFKTIAKHSN